MVRCALPPNSHFSRPNSCLKPSAVPKAFWLKLEAHPPCKAVTPKPFYCTVYQNIPIHIKPIQAASFTIILGKNHHSAVSALKVPRENCPPSWQNTSPGQNTVIWHLNIYVQHLPFVLLSLKLTPFWRMPDSPLPFPRQLCIGTPLRTSFSGATSSKSRRHFWSLHPMGSCHLHTYSSSLHQLPRFPLPSWNLD